MKLDHPQNVTLPEHLGELENFVPAKIADEDLGLAQDFFASIYTQRRDAVIRELAANAIDAHRAIGSAAPIHVYLPSGGPRSSLVVVDHGVGMSLETLTGYANRYLKSLKRHDSTAIGGFGVGLHSPLAVVDWFSIITTHEGVTTEAVIAKLPTGGTGMKVVRSEFTGGYSGTEVLVPVFDPQLADDDDDASALLYESLDHDERELRHQEAVQWRAAAQRTFYWWEKGTVLLDESEPRNYRDDALKDSFVNAEGVHVVHEAKGSIAVQTTVLINGIGYTVPRSILERPGLFRTNYRTAYVIDAGDGGQLTADGSRAISRNRESLEDTEQVVAWLQGVYRRWTDSLRESFKQLLDGVSTALELDRRCRPLHDLERAEVQNNLGLKFHELRTKRFNFVRSVSAPMTSYLTSSRISIWRYEHQLRNNPLSWYDLECSDLEKKLLANHRGSRAIIGIEALERMADGSFITPHEFSKVKKTPFDRWRKDQGVNFTLTVVEPDHPDLPLLFTEDQIEWIDAEQLSASFPKPARKKPTPDRINLVTRYVDIGRWNVSNAYRLSTMQETLVADARALIPDDHQVIAATAAEIDTYPIDPATQTLIARGSRSVKAIAELLGREVLSPIQALQKNVDALLESMSMAQRRRVINTLSLFRTRAWAPETLQETWPARIGTDISSLRKLVDNHGKSLSPEARHALGKILLEQQDFDQAKLLLNNVPLVMNSRYAPKDLFTGKYPVLASILDTGLPSGRRWDPQVINAVVAADCASWRSTRATKS